MSTSFAGAVVVDEQPTMLNFEIPCTSIARLSGAFRTMEANKERLGVVDYALSQSTLEQVYCVLVLLLLLLLGFGIKQISFCCRETT